MRSRQVEGDGREPEPGASLLRQRPGELAIAGWLISAALAVGVAAGLTAAGYIRDYVPVGLALTTTALGTLLVYRRTLPARQRVEMTFIIATMLPC